MKKDYSEQARTKNKYGEFVPDIPLPYYFGWGFKKSRCSCGKEFKKEVDYRGHYALEHILGLK